MITPTVTFEAKLVTEFAMQDGTIFALQDGTDMLLNGGAWTDITDDVSSRTVTCTRGIPGNGVNDRIANDGVLTFYMKNDTTNSAGLLGYYSLDHTNKRQGWGTDVQVRVSFSHSSYDSGTAHVRFYGRITSIAPVPGQYADRVVRVTAKDYINILNEYEQVPQTELLEDTTSAAAYQAVVDSLAVQPAGTSFDTGIDVLDYVFQRSGERSGSAFEEFNRIALSSLDFLFVAADGTLTTQNREARIGKSVLFTLNEDLMDYSPDEEKSRLVDRVVTVTYPTEVGSSNEIVYEAYPKLRIDSGDSVSFSMDYKDQNSNRSVGMKDPIPISFYFGSYRDGESNDLNSDLSASVTYYAAQAYGTFTNSGTKTGYLNYVKVMGTALKTFEAVRTETQVNSGRSSTIRLNMPYQSDPNVGQSANDMISNVYGTNAKQYSNPVYTANRDTDTFGFFMDGEIGEAIAITETVSGASAQKVFIQSEKWSLSPGRILKITYGTARARDETPFTIGTSLIGGSHIIMFAQG